MCAEAVTPNFKGTIETNKENLMGGGLIFESVFTHPDYSDVEPGFGATQELSRADLFENLMENENHV